MITEPSFTIGVEEEYLLVERDTRELVSSLPPPVLAEYRELLGEQVSPEFLQCQIEVGTRVCTTMPELREELVRLRRGVAEVAERNGLAVVAASSHPFARRGFQQLTPRERYRILAEDMQEVARRLVISGMHVHVGIEDPEVRIDLLSQSSYVLPHLLALSTSSPFWEGADTGLKSYRIAVWDEMPRSGLPPGFESWSEYERHIGVLVDAGLIEDASKIWWDLRPSARFPTLEMRICDVCTRLEDALCLAALYRCWLRMMFRLRRGNQRWRTYRAFLLDENRWRAQRYGVDGSLIDFGRGELVAVRRSRRGDARALRRGRRAFRLPQGGGPCADDRPARDERPPAARRLQRRGDEGRGPRGGAAGGRRRPRRRDAGRRAERDGSRSRRASG